MFSQQKTTGEKQKSTKIKSGRSHKGKVTHIVDSSNADNGKSALFVKIRK